ncbi:unnamed protein product [Lymnaea stagnalis]|uniref:Receptor protein-tyrosine kinase n=1 Tax=Lymnaea stagnalis TaxID=6523 RepID=A0AAV2GX77_LYMST
MVNLKSLLMNLLAVTCFVLSHLYFANGSFIVLQNQIAKLASLASIAESPPCDDQTLCKRSFNETTCLQKHVCFPDSVCNGRKGLPAVEYPFSNWQAAKNKTGCTLSSTPPPQPPPTTGSLAGAKTLLVNGSADQLDTCFAQRNGSLGPRFTLVFWLYAECRNCSVIEMPQSANNAAIHIRIVNNTTVCVESLVRSLCKADMITKQSIAMFSIRVIDSKLDIFINQNSMNLTSGGFNNVSVSNLYIGNSEIPRMNDIFYLHDVKFYNDSLSSNELAEIETGLVEPVEASECQCPIEFFERLKNDSNTCTNGIKTFPRFNRTLNYYTPDYIKDNITQSARNWASADSGDVNLTVTMATSFQIDHIEIMFDSEVPKAVSAIFISSGLEKMPKFFTCVNKICSLNTTSLINNITVSDYQGQIADKIKILLQRQNDMIIQSFVLTNLTISGRCDCNGNAAGCSEINETYRCVCDPVSHTQGSDCRVCTPPYYRNLDQFDCPRECQCHPDGIMNSSHPCEKGQCQCKANVEGPLCDTCKTFTYNLSNSNSQGCTPCNCNQLGSSACNNITGQCSCKANTKVPNCDGCNELYFGLSNPEGCAACNCETVGTINQSTSCNQTTGQCPCKVNVNGPRCDTCKTGFYQLEIANVRGCKPCNCSLVGSVDNQCHSQSGQCPCRGGVFTDKHCTPRIDSVEPDYGPMLGGTLVTIRGSLLGNDTDAISVFLDNTKQVVKLAEDNLIIFSTTVHNGSEKAAQNLTLSWEQDSTPVYSQKDFLYKPNPVVSTNSMFIKSFVSGGCVVRIYGDNLQNIKHPQLEVIKMAVPKRIASVNCRHNPDHVLCQTPEVNDLYTSAQDKFQLTARFDGLVLHSIGNISIHPDPVFNDVGNIRFQYPFEDTITLTGKDLTEGCHTDELTVLLGVVNCYIHSVSSTEIVCQPPVSPLSGATKLTIEVRIGNIKRVVGTMEYLPLHETTNFIIIISCIAAGIFLVIVIFILIICCRWYRNRKKNTSTFTQLERKTPIENNTMNDYSEMTTPVNSQPPPENGTVRMETVLKEPKLGIVNTSAEDAIFIEEFIPKVDAGLREEIRQCYIGGGHFAVGRVCIVKGKQAMLTDGSLQNTSTVSGQKLYIKMPINLMTESTLPSWANLALSECLRLKRHKHIHLLGILGIGIDKNRFHILYPRMSQNFLKTVVSDMNKNFSVRQLLSFGQQVAEGVNFLTSKDITHKDIAARNCMLDESLIVKLSDAAFSWDFFPDEYVYDEKRERYLPIRWMAPESFSDGYYDMRTDVWSFAVLVWELLTRGCMPFHEVDDSDVKNYVLEGYILGKPDTLSDDVYEVLKSCWSPENENRPSIAAVSRSLGAILEADDEIYANTKINTSFRSQHASGLAASPRHRDLGNQNIYSATNFSRV